jgi:drug/metabolite transporter (DMT)-like permease
VRFGVAGLAAVAVFHRSLAGVSARELCAGFAVGLCIFAGYALQTEGLRTISSSTSAFITALYVPLVPMIQWLVLRRRPRVATLVGTALAFVGLLCLAGPGAGALRLGPGEALTLSSAVAIAAEILLIGGFSGSVDTRRVTTIQLLVGSALSFAAMPVAGESVPAFSWAWALPAAGLGVASIIIQWTMNWAQKTISATRATLIYASEPVWAGIIGAMAGERLPALSLLGAACIVAGVVVSEVPLPAKVREGEEKETFGESSQQES